MADIFTHLCEWFSLHVNWWTLFGLFGQSMFMMRFIIQWVASEKQKQSVIPEAFWYFSIAGGLIVLVYGIGRNDLVIILGQATGIFIYIRNLVFIHNGKKAARLAAMAN